MDFRYKILMMLMMVVAIGGIGYATNIRTSDGSAVSVGSNLDLGGKNITNVSISDFDYFYSGRGANGEDILRLFPINETTGYTQIAFYPEANKSRVEGDVLFNIHKELYDLSATHRHFSIYTTDSNNLLVHRLDLEYQKDLADLIWSNILDYNLNAENIILRDVGDGGNEQWGGVDFKAVGGDVYFLFNPQPNVTTKASVINFFQDTNTTGTKQFRIYKGDNTDTITFRVDASDGSLDNVGDITLNNVGVSATQTISFNGARGSLKYNGTSGTMDLVGGSGKNIRLLTGGNNVQIGDGSSQKNITLTSPDGTEYNCGVSNGGAFSCS